MISGVPSAEDCYYRRAAAVFVLMPPSPLHDSVFSEDVLSRIASVVQGQMSCPSLSFVWLGMEKPAPVTHFNLTHAHTHGQRLQMHHCLSVLRKSWDCWLSFTLLSNSPRVVWESQQQLWWHFSTRGCVCLICCPGLTACWMFPKWNTKSRKKGWKKWQTRVALIFYLSNRFFSGAVPCCTCCSHSLRPDANYL